MAKYMTKLKESVFDDYINSKNNLIMDSFVDLLCRVDIPTLCKHVEANIDLNLGLESEYFNDKKSIPVYVEGKSFYFRTYISEEDKVYTLEIDNSNGLHQVQIVYSDLDSKISLISSKVNDTKILTIYVDSKDVCIIKNNFKDISEELEIITTVLDNLFIFDFKEEAVCFDVIKLMQQAIDEIVKE